MCRNSPASKMNSAFIPSKPVALFLYSFFNAWNNSINVIFVFRMWLGGGSITWIEWSIRSCMGGEDWPTSSRKPSKSITALILSTTGALGRYFFPNESTSTLASVHICWALVISQQILFLFNNFLRLFCWCLTACELWLAFNQSLNSRFAIW